MNIGGRVLSKQLKTHTRLQLRKQNYWKVLTPSDLVLLWTTPCSITKFWTPPTTLASWLRQLSIMLLQIWMVSRKTSTETLPQSCSYWGITWLCGPVTWQMQPKTRTQNELMSRLQTGTSSLRWRLEKVLLKIKPLSLPNAQSKRDVVCWEALATKPRLRAKQTWKTVPAASLLVAVHQSA